MKIEYRSVWIFGLVAAMVFLIPVMTIPYISQSWVEGNWQSIFGTYSLAGVLLTLGLTYSFSYKANKLKYEHAFNSDLIINKLPYGVWVFSLEDQVLRSSNNAAEEVFRIGGTFKREQGFRSLFYDPDIVDQIMEGKNRVFRKILMIDKNYDGRYMDLFAIPFIHQNRECVLVLVVDQSEITLSLRKIEALSESLKEQNHQLREFSFINSHNLRSQLSNILGLLNLYDTEESLSGKTLEMIKISAQKLDGELMKINEILMENRVDEHKIAQVRRTIVFVDDDKVQHMINKRILLKINGQLDLVFFENPYEALDWLQKNKADVVLLDINMPEMDGWHFLELMKKKGIDIDVKMLTSSLDPDDLERSKNFQSVSGFLIKPLKSENIVKFLAN